MKYQRSVTKIDKKWRASTLFHSFSIIGLYCLTISKVSPSTAFTAVNTRRYLKETNIPCFKILETSIGAGSIDIIEMEDSSPHHTHNDHHLLTIIPKDQYKNTNIPTEFAYPFCYQPHPIAVYASDVLKKDIQALTRHNWTDHNFGILSQSNDMEDDTDDHTHDDRHHHDHHDHHHNTQKAVGKMFGILVVRIPNDNHDYDNDDTDGSSLGFLRAYSGTINGVTYPENYGFCPSLYNRFHVDDKHSIMNNNDNDNSSSFCYEQEEAKLNELNQQVKFLEQSPQRIQCQHILQKVQNQTTFDLTKAKQMEKKQKKKRKLRRKQMKEILTTEEFIVLEDELAQESAFYQRQVKQVKKQCKEQLEEAQRASDVYEMEIQRLKDKRKQDSAKLQNLMFEQYQFLNINGQTKSLLPIFAETPLGRPPSGAGDCAAPRLFQYAFQQKYKPIALAEFWWGKAPLQEIRKHNFFYPACRGKCLPILTHMLDGMQVQENPLETVGMSPFYERLKEDLGILYEDSSIVVVNKPPEMLSVPGRSLTHSVYTEIQKRYPNATGPLLVHRLDMSTSGILLIALDDDSHRKLQSQFINRTVKKRYTALLDGRVDFVGKKGEISLPLTSDYLHRPMQKVDFEEGKSAVTEYEILAIEGNQTKIHFFPVTGRTHQLRVHAAHEKGLNTPIVGDDIYGKRDKRLFLHAGYIEFQHPISKEEMTFVVDDPF